MDQIIIENLQIFAHHGVYREENEKGQNFYINAVLETDIMRAGRLDDLELSTNYGEVCRFLDQFIKADRDGGREGGGGYTPPLSSGQESHTGGTQT